MKNKLISNIGYNNLDGKEFTKQKKYKELYFRKNIYKESANKNAIFVLGFVEFGCESFYPHYLLPKIIKSNPNYRIVFLGWPNRDYYYKHLVDEYWEITGDYSHLRSSARAMFNESISIVYLENYLKKYGKVISSQALGNQLVECMCLECKNRVGSIKEIKVCSRCMSTNVRQSILSDIKSFYKEFKYLPAFKKFVEIPANSVAIFARKRDAYGRNLSKDFYVKLIEMLKDQGYNPIWLGESCSILPCPVKDILDFTKDGDIPLEKTIQIVSECIFSIQFWTASTRISIQAETPFIIIETPDQIYGQGQEGARLKFLNPKKIPCKLILSNFKSFTESENEGLEIIKKCIHEFINESNYNECIGLVGNKDFVIGLKDGK